MTISERFLNPVYSLEDMSMRERLIIAQALTLGIKALKEVPEPYQETSNILDMEYIITSFFPEFKEMSEFMLGQHEDILKRLEKGELN